MMMTIHTLEATLRRRLRPTSLTWLMAIQTLSRCIDLIDQPGDRIMQTRIAMGAVVAARMTKKIVRKVEKTMMLRMREKLVLAKE